jgi:hypothetical protein
MMVAAAAAVAAACGGGGGPPVNITGPATGLAVINSDYQSTSVSLVDPDTRALVRDDCVDSGSAPLQPSPALSGDVVLPSQPQAGHALVLIDRQNDAISWVDPTTCQIQKQLSVMTGFHSIPHDVVSISANKAYVTRYAKNFDTPTDANGLGDDLLIIDPQAKTITGRIDLSAYAAPVAGADIQARPDSGVFIDGKVYVSLGSQDRDYAVAGIGRVAIVDAATDQVTGTIDIPGFKGCSRLAYLAASKALYVACGGLFADPIDVQIAESGIAIIDLGASPPVVKQTISGTAIGAGSVNFSWVAPLASDLLLAGTLGTTDPVTYQQTSPDTAQAINPGAGTAVKVLQGDAFALGRAAGTPAGWVYLPDGSATKPIVHVFAPAATPVAAAVDLDSNPSNHLPPREIAWY